MSFRETIHTVMASVLSEVSDTVWSIGSRTETSRTSPPSVRWAPVTDTVTTPRKVATTDRLARIITGLSTTFRVTCWGADYEQADLLRDAVLRGCRLAAPTYALGQSGAWLDSDAVSEGEAVELTVTFHGHVTEAPAPTTVTITDVDTTDTEVTPT